MLTATLLKTLIGLWRCTAHGASIFYYDWEVANQVVHDAGGIYGSKRARLDLLRLHGLGLAKHKELDGDTKFALTAKGAVIIRALQDMGLPRGGSWKS
jgi:hypothetical protein